MTVHWYENGPTVVCGKEILVYPKDVEEKYRRYLVNCNQCLSIVGSGIKIPIIHYQPDTKDTKMLCGLERKQINLVDHDFVCMPENISLVNCDNCIILSNLTSEVIEEASETSIYSMTTERWASYLGYGSVSEMKKALQ